MPELPEVEHLRRSLEPCLLGRRVLAVTLSRADTADTHDHRPPSPDDLLLHQHVRGTRRHGKQLAILGDLGLLRFGLGMTGSLLVLRDSPLPPHAHVTWSLDDGSTLAFVDPRRFGSLTTHPDAASLDHHWRTSLGPDALSIRAAALHTGLADRRAPVKALLLDQRLLAGVGNIYADEALFLARLHPSRPGVSLTPSDTNRLARAIRSILRTAIARGGSSIRSYRDALGLEGSNQHFLRIYAHGGEPCPSCRSTLISARIAQRTTTWCPACQPASSLQRRRRT